MPKFLQAWLSWRATWQTFSFEFLKSWGGRWAPALDRGGDSGGGAWWLWVTSIYVHQNLNHIISNLLLFIAMSVHLELNYGWWRLLLVWIISGALLVSGGAAWAARLDHLVCAAARLWRCIAGTASRALVTGAALVGAYALRLWTHISALRAAVVAGHGAACMLQWPAGADTALHACRSGRACCQSGPHVRCF